MKRALFVPVAAAGLALMAVVAVSVSHAGSARPDTGIDPGSNRYQCFDPNFVRSFHTVNSNKLIITSDRNQAYELTLGGVCIGLDTSFQIGIRSRHGMSDICGPFDGDIVYSDGLRGLQSCSINSVRHLEGEEAAPYVRTPSSERGGDRRGDEAAEQPR